MTYYLETIDTLDVLERNAVRWDELFDAALNPEPYLSHCWLCNWYRYFAAEKQIMVLVVKRGAQWAGLLPLVMSVQRSRGGAVRTLGFPVNQESGNLRCDMLFRQDPDEVATLIVRHLAQNQDNWECWDLSGLPVVSHAFAPLTKAVDHSGLCATMWQVGLELYYLTLNGSWDSYLQQRSRRFRKGLNNTVNRLSKAGQTEIRTYCSPDELAAALALVITIDRKSTKAGCPGVVLVENEVADFYHSLVRNFGARGECWIYLLFVDQTPVASLLNFRCHGRDFFLHNSYLPEVANLGPGRVLIMHVIKEACEQGVGEIDFNGRTTFVQSWSSTARPVLSCLLYNQTLRSKSLRHWRQFLLPLVRRARLPRPLLSLVPSPQSAKTVGGSPGGDLPQPFRCDAPIFYQDGKTALKYGIQALGLQPDEEVLFPSYHCGSEFNVLLEHGLRLKYYPVLRDLRVDRQALQNSLTSNTRAVYVIHYLGWPQDIAAVSAFCRENGLLLIEDCAQALYGGSAECPIGMLSDLAIFSPHKFLPMVDGGAAVIHERQGKICPAPAEFYSSSDRLAISLHNLEEKVRCYGGWPAGCGYAVVWMVNALLRRFRRGPRRMMTISAASQKVWLHTDHCEVMARRRQNFRSLCEVFADMAGVSLWREDLERGAVPLLFPLFVDNPAPLLASLANAGIESAVHWSAADPRFPIGDFPETTFLKAHLVVLPLHQILTTADLQRIGRVVEEFCG